MERSGYASSRIVSKRKRKRWKTASCSSAGAGRIALVVEGDHRTRAEPTCRRAVATRLAAILHLFHFQPERNGTCLLHGYPPPAEPNIVRRAGHGPRAPTATRAPAAVANVASSSGFDHAERLLQRGSPFRNPQFLTSGSSWVPLGESNRSESVLGLSGGSRGGGALPLLASAGDPRVRVPLRGSTASPAHFRKSVLEVRFRPVRTARRSGRRDEPAKPCDDKGSWRPSYE